MKHTSLASTDVAVAAGRGITLSGLLQIPDRAAGLIVFVHGSGSSRFSPRNRQVADTLTSHRFGILLMDLLTPGEEQVDDVTRKLRFDIPMLAQRVIGTLDWLATQDAVKRLPIGLFGASTGAAAALIAAASQPERVAAVVSRGGRPDLAGPALASVQAPTLLIVGGDDLDVLELNRIAMSRLHATKQLVTIAGATHLFEEPGTLAEVAQHAAAWFATHLDAQARKAS